MFLLGKIKVVIFDWDGTLVDSMGEHINASIKAFEKFGIKGIKPAELLELVGTPTETLVEILAKKHNLSADGKKIAKQKIDNYLKFTENRNMLYPDALKTLKKLKKKYKLALFSGSTRVQLKRYENVLEIFDLTIAGKEASKPKPAPDALLLIAKKMKVKPRECIYVGDLKPDMKAAKSAGMLAIGIRNSLISDQELKEAGADIIINNIKELTDKGIV